MTYLIQAKQTDNTWRPYPAVFATEEQADAALDAITSAAREGWLTFPYPKLVTRVYRVIIAETGEWLSRTSVVCVDR